MDIRLNPRVLDDARQRHGFTSDERLAEAMRMSGHAIRELRKGNRAPAVSTLVRLSRLTAWPIDGMLLVSEKTPDQAPAA